MKPLILTVLLIFGLNSFLFPQSGINHWGFLINEDIEWRYFLGTSNPEDEWINPDFDDTKWQRAKGSIGHGHLKIKNKVEPVASIFMRAYFEVPDIGTIKHVLLHLDYDDGFVAYLNGVEIVRDGIEGSFPIPHNAPAANGHTAKLNDSEPERFHFTSKELEGILNEGSNVLAIEVHNFPGDKTSDLIARVFLSVGATHPSDEYRPVPKWFSPPTFLTSSSHPILVINTNNKKFPGDAAFPATMGIVNGDTENHIDDPFNDYEGRIHISLRGNSSRTFDQKSFRIETQNENGGNHNVSLLGLPEENDWVLYAPYADKSLMRNVLTYKLWRDLGYYSPRTRYVEVVVNNEYQGVYVLTEKIKIDKNRVNIASLDNDDVTGDKVTGGYLLRADKDDPDDYPPWSSESIRNDFKPVQLQFYDPDGVDLKQRQRDYIRGYIHDFENALSDDDFADETNGYRPFINMESFIDFMIVQEISKNVDGYVYSTYMHKDRDSRDGRLTMGPVWDFDLAYGNVDYSNPAMHPPGWLYTGRRMFWFKRMMEDENFSEAYKCRWHSLRNSWMTNSYFLDKIDSLSAALDESQRRHYEKWGTMGKYVWPNQFVGKTYQGDVDFMKEWIVGRLTWMDMNLARGVCADAEPAPYNGKIYPNPGTDYFTIPLQEYPSGSLKIEIFSSMGQLQFSHTTNTTEFVWFTGIIPGGLYHVRIYRNGVMVSEQHLIKR